MAPIALFALAARQAEWLTQRQAILSQNIANVSTPGYRAQDARPFAEALERAPLALAATEPGHLADAPRTTVVAARPRAAGGWEAGVSGNDVSLDQELMRANDVNRAYALNANIVRAFQRMAVAGLKG